MCPAGTASKQSCLINFPPVRVTQTAEVASQEFKIQVVVVVPHSRSKFSVPEIHRMHCGPPSPRFLDIRPTMPPPSIL